jgi:hypothetical protein
MPNPSHSGFEWAQSGFTPTSSATPSAITSQVGLMKTVPRQPVPEVTVAFKMYQAGSETPGLEVSPSVDMPSNQSSGSYSKALIGGIAGTLAIVMLALMLIVFCRGGKYEYGKRSEAEKGRAHRRYQPSTQDAINEAHQRRKHRNRRSRERDVQPYGLTLADMNELSLQGNVMAAEQHYLGTSSQQRSIDHTSPLGNKGPSHSTQAGDWMAAPPINNMTQPHNVERPIQVPTRKSVPRPKPVITIPADPHLYHSYRASSSISPLGDDFETVDLSNHYAHENISPLSSSTAYGRYGHRRHR